MREMQPPLATPNVLLLAAAAYQRALALGWSRERAFALFVATYAAGYLITSRRRHA